MQPLPNNRIGKVIQHKPEDGYLDLSTATCIYFGNDEPPKQAFYKRLKTRLKQFFKL